MKCVSVFFGLMGEVLLMVKNFMQEKLFEGILVELELNEMCKCFLWLNGEVFFMVKNSM